MAHGAGKVAIPNRHHIKTKKQKRKMITLHKRLESLRDLAQQKSDSFTEQGDEAASAIAQDIHTSCEEWMEEILGLDEDDD